MAADAYRNHLKRINCESLHSMLLEPLLEFSVSNASNNEHSLVIDLKSDSHHPFIQIIIYHDLKVSSLIKGELSPIFGHIAILGGQYEILDVTNIIRKDFTRVDEDFRIQWNTDNKVFECISTIPNGENFTYYQHSVPVSNSVGYEALEKIESLNEQYLMNHIESTSVCSNGSIDYLDYYIKCKEFDVLDKVTKKGGNLDVQC